MNTNTKFQVFKGSISRQWFAICPCGDSRLKETWDGAMAWIPVHMVTCHDSGSGAPSSSIYVDIVPDMTGWDAAMDTLREAFPKTSAEMERLGPVRPMPQFVELNFDDMDGGTPVKAEVPADKTTATGWNAVPSRTGMTHVPAGKRDWAMEVAMAKKWERYRHLGYITDPYFDHDGMAKWPGTDYGKFTVKVPPTVSPDMERRLMEANMTVIPDPLQLHHLLQSTYYEGIYDDNE